MTDDFVIPEEAIEAGTQVYERGLGPGVHRMEDVVAAILRAALPHLRAHQIEVQTRIGHALGRQEALKEIADEMGLSHAWQMDDPRVNYVDVQIDKDTYRQLVAARDAS